MLDPPQPTYGRFTVPPAELQPRDASDWLEDAEDAIRHAHNQSLPQRRRRGPLERSPISHGTHLTDSGLALSGANVRDRITIPYSNDLLGDLAEEFHLRTELDGLTAAQAWYRRQIILSIKDHFWTTIERLAALGTLIDLASRFWDK